MDWKKIVIPLVAVLVCIGASLPIAFISLTTLAIATAGCELLDSIPFIDCEMAFGDHRTRCNAPISDDLSESVPEEWGTLFAQAGGELDVNPNVLAALYLSENSNEWRPLDYNWDKSTGEEDPGGPMQFKPGTFRGFEVEGHGDIMDPEDAIYAAANLIKSAEYGPTNSTTPLGEIERPWKRDTILYTVGAYNWGSGNAANTDPEAGIDVSPTETQNYQTNVYELVTSNFTKGGPGHGDPTGLGVGNTPSTAGDVVPAAGTAAPDTAAPDESESHTHAPAPDVTEAPGDPAAGDIPEHTGALSWPVAEGTPIPEGGRWGDPRSGGGHHGLDFSAPLGDPIYAVADGKVVFAQNFDPDGYGSMIKIQSIIDGKMVETWYAHMPDPTEFVREGAMVEAGEQIASIGQAGNSTGPHLHFEVHPEGGAAINPEPWLEDNGATTVSPGNCGGSGDVGDVDPPEKDGNGNWPAETCSVKPDPTNNSGCVTPRTKIAAEMMYAWGVPEGHISCYSDRATGEHPKGRACDVTMGAIGTRASGADKEMGGRLAAFLQANYETWAIEYVIWYGEIWSASRKDEGWRPYQTAGSGCDVKETTCGHYDHVHVTIY